MAETKWKEEGNIETALQTSLLNFDSLAEEIKSLTKEILKNRWKIADKLFYIKEHWQEYKEQEDFPYNTFKKFVEHYYSWTHQEANYYVDAHKLKLLLEDKGKPVYLVENIGISTADKLYELSGLNEEKAIELIEENPNIDRRSVERKIKELNGNNSDFVPKVYDVWNFSGCDARFGIEYPGRIPGQLIMNCLHYYTREGDVVIDFMAGGGTTQDVCNFINRKCYSFDIKPARDFITKHNLLNGNNNIQLPKLEKKPNLIFVDPPYWSMKREQYDGGFSDVSLDVFYKRIENFAKECYMILDKKGIFAFLIQNQTGRDIGNKEAILHTYICAKTFEKIGFEFIRSISCPQSTQQDEPQEIIKAKKERRMLGRVRDLLIFRK